MKRATLAELRKLLETTGQPAAISPVDLRAPLDQASIDALLPELYACRGVLQNNYHHLDVYEHTWEVVRGLERMVACGFERHGNWAEKLRAHFASPTLLYLAGLCHDVGKPATQSFARDGRIRFIGHDHLGAEMVRHSIGPRLGLAADIVTALANLVEVHLEAVMIPPEGGESSRIHRLFAKTGRHLPELALLSLADVEAARGPAQTLLRLEEQAQFIDFLLEQFFEGGFLANPTLPVSVDDLYDQFGKLEEKTQRRILESLMEAFVDGEFEGREEGLALAAEFLSSF